MLDVVIPCLDSAHHLPATLASVTVAGLIGQLIVCDGGSADHSVAIARASGARVVTAPRGRGNQLGAGAAESAAPWLLFLHADTRLSAGWAEQARRFMADPANRERAAHFRLRFDSDDPAARRVERAANWRSERLGLPYGDQGLLIGRAFYESLGGFRAMPLMEDVDLVRRIGRRRLTALAAEALTSAERYERDGWLRRPARNLACLALYGLGVPPRVLLRLYR